MKKIAGIIIIYAVIISCNSNDTSRAGVIDSTKASLDTPKAVIVDSSKPGPATSSPKKDSAH